MSSERAQKTRRQMLPPDAKRKTPKGAARIDSQCTDVPSALRAKAHYRALIYTVI